MTKSRIKSWPVKTGKIINQNTMLNIKVLKSYVGAIKATITRGGKLIIEIQSKVNSKRAVC